jgi:hypothetical protein
MMVVQAELQPKRNTRKYKGEGRSHPSGLLGIHIRKSLCQGTQTLKENATKSMVTLKTIQMAAQQSDLFVKTTKEVAC